MGDLRSILTDELKEELFDRLSELTSGGLEGGLEGLDSMALTVDVVEREITRHEESAGTYGMAGGLEAIIMQFGRPAFFVKGDSFAVGETPSSSELVNAKVNAARAHLEAAIPRVGRIDLRNHRAPWVGTGWVVAENVVVTNRHVAAEFAERDGDEFVFAESFDGRVAKASLDTYREHRSPKESIFRLPKVHWIEPKRQGHHDVAFLSVASRGEDDQPQPAPIELMSDEELAAMAPGRWVAVIGYPAFSPYNDAADQQRIFQGVFDVKRLQPGTTSSFTPDEILHDASTLGGNSGSVVLDLESGKAMALHFGGYEGETNYAVSASVVRRLLRDRLGID